MLTRSPPPSRFSSSSHLLRRLYSQVKSNPNQPIVDLLLKRNPLPILRAAPHSTLRAIDKQEEQNKADSNAFKVHAFSKAVHAVMQYQHPIRSGDDLNQSSKLRGIGPGIIARINEHLLSDHHMQDEDPALYDELRRSQALSALSSIPGIGSTTAKKLVNAGCLSVADLKSGNFASLLTAKQIAKIKYADHLDCHVKREEAEEVLEFCRDSLEPQHDLTLVGDYRRGITSFSDIHIMISHPNFVHVPLPNDQNPEDPSDTPKKRPRGRKKNDEKPSLLLSSVVPLLQQRGLIAETLSSTAKTWQGIVRIPGQRDDWGDRLDRISAVNNVEGDFRKATLHLVPQKSRGSSLICLTGDGDFEKDICYRAQQRGMLFNEYGLWRWTSNSSSSASPESANSPTQETHDGVSPSEEAGYWSLLNSTTEEDIFRELGMEFVDPTRRNFSYVNGKKKRKKRTASALP